MRFPLHIELRRSRLLSALTVVLHGVAGVCLLFVPWPPALRYLLLLVVVLSAWFVLRGPRFVGLCLLDNHALACRLASGEHIPVVVQPDTVVCSRLIVLRVRDGDTGRRCSLTLLPDSLPADQFRLLRLWLRWRTDPSDRVEGAV